MLDLSHAEASTMFELNAPFYPSRSETGVVFGVYFLIEVVFTPFCKWAYQVAVHLITWCSKVLHTDQVRGRSTF